MSQRTWIVVLACCLLVGLFGQASATIHNVAIGNNFFSPAEITVNHGDTVTWTLTAGTHTTTSAASSRKTWNSGVMNTVGQTYTIIITPLDGPGPFDYDCTIHAGMSGRIVVQGPSPNSVVAPGASSFGDQLNPSIAIGEFGRGSAMSVYTNFTAPGAFGPTVIGWSWTASGGTPGTWTSAVKPPDPPYTQEWNSWISAVGGAAGGSYVMVGAQRDGPPWVAPSNAIVANVSPGLGTGFGVGVPLLTSITGRWLDYPVVEVDDGPGSSGFGDALFSWVSLVDLTGGDSDGNGNPYDDAGDQYDIWTASSSIGGGSAPAYPAFTAPFIHFSGPMYAASPASHRPAIDIAGVGNPLLPPGGAYVAWMDVVGGAILIDATPTPGAGAGWGALTGGTGPLAVLGYIPVPPVINPGIAAANAVTIACDNSPSSACPGAVYLAWTDAVTGDVDIMFAASFDGGLTWSAPVRVNQDPIANGADQWAPHMRVDEYSGDILISYYDRRNSPLNTDIEVWLSRSSDCGATWSDCVLTDSGPFPPISATTNGFAQLVGDYLGTDQHLLQGPGFVWNDSRNGMDQDVMFGAPTDCCVGLTGDMNGDGNTDLADIIYLVNALFSGGPAPLCATEADVNGSGTTDLPDVIYLVNALFLGGPAPVPCPPDC
ncbi:hypothetical protein GF420_14480 [candidate division GN15 bacterium]|nr:hypothetical protein [candidate division GN15 bacterium]